MNMDLSAPIRLLNYQLLSGGFKFLSPVEDIHGIRELFASYPISLEYEVKRNRKENLFLVLLKIGVNPGKFEDQKDGYELHAEVVSTFDTSRVEQAVPDAEKHTYILYTSLAIATHNVRACLRDMTMSAPMGPYSLPTIDIGKLVKNVQQKKHEGEPPEVTKQKNSKKAKRKS